MRNAHSLSALWAAVAFRDCLTLRNRPHSARSREITGPAIFVARLTPFTIERRGIDSKYPMTWRLPMLRVRLAGWTGLQSVSRQLSGSTSIARSVESQITELFEKM